MILCTSTTCTVKSAHDVALEVLHLFVLFTYTAVFHQILPLLKLPCFDGSLEHRSRNFNFSKICVHSKFGSKLSEV